jgi:hypothetical protein
MTAGQRIQGPASTSMDHNNFLPSTPEYYPMSNGSPYHSGQLSFDGLMLDDDVKGIPMDDGAIVFTGGYAHYGDRYPPAWSYSWL